MNTLLLHPTDTLFFRDGRPMSGSLAGHGAAWPLPTVLNAALHAALHRAEFADVHPHRCGRSSQRDENAERNHKFGSLVTAGPFPVCMKDKDPTWFFPRPADAGQRDATTVALLPAASAGASSLPTPLTCAVANTETPTKHQPAPWWSASAWRSYLGASAPLGPSDFRTDSDFADTEFSIGIGISAETGTQNGEQFYSSHSLRLRDGWTLGSLAEAMDKVDGNPASKRDLIQHLFPNSGTQTPVIVGGQQRLCTVERHSGAALPLPTGSSITGSRVKWVLLTPAIFPQINDHSGGWLPSWIHHRSGDVMLLDGPGKNYAQRHKLPEGKPIPARLVAAIVSKPIPVTGYALPHEAAGREDGGAKPTHLAVPAGSVYYFECEGEEAARKLAAALNWHGTVAPSVPLEGSGNAGVPPAAGPGQAGSSPHIPQAGGIEGTTIRNRRSTLMGEKGFGLGVCGTWEFYNPQHTS